MARSAINFMFRRIHANPIPVYQNVSQTFKKVVDSLHPPWLTRAIVKEPRDSLGGQNSGRRLASVRSSRTLSTLRDKLRKLDREISLLRFGKSGLDVLKMLAPYGSNWRKEYNRRMDRIAKLDAQRREVRHRLKAR